MGALKYPTRVRQSTLLWDRWHLGMAKGTVPQCSPSDLVDDGSKVGRTVELDGAQALEVGLQHAFNASTAGVLHIVVLGYRDGVLGGGPQLLVSPRLWDAGAECCQGASPPHQAAVGTRKTSSAP